MKAKKQHIKLSYRQRPSLQAAVGMLACLLFLASACKVSYSLKDASIDYAKYKTIKLSYIENKARYINPQLAQKFTDKILQKITTGTKLTRTNNENADYVISGTITNYDPSQTVGISTQQATTNRLTVTMHMVVKDNPGNKTDEFDVSRSFDYSANLSLQQAEGQLLDEVVRTLTDEIFNQIFSKW